MNPHLKFAAARVLSHLPGKVGERFETSALWAARAMRSRSSGNLFAAELARLTPGDLCIDLGANVGEVTEQLAARAGHVHAFEPDPWAFAQLEERVGHLANVTLHNAAIGPESGTLTLLRDPGMDEVPEIRSQGSSAFRSLLWEPGEPQSIEVPMVGIADFLRTLDRPVALLKIDIEGGEVALIDALLASHERERVEVVFVETHECQIPELRPATAAMRKRLATVTHPRFHLEWH